MTVEKAPIPEGIRYSLRNMSRHTASWLESDRNVGRPKTESERVNNLIFNAFNLMLDPNTVNKKWSIHSLKHELNVRTKKHYPPNILKEAAELAVYEFVEKGVLGVTKDKWLPKDRELGNRTRLVVRSGPVVHLIGVESAIMAGQGGDADKKQIQRLQNISKRIRASLQNR